MSKKERVYVYLSKEEKEQLYKVARLNRMSVSSYIAYVLIPKLFPPKQP